MSTWWGCHALDEVMSGDRPDFDERAAVLGALAYRVGYRILGDRHESEDLTQEALARAFARWSRIGAYDEAWITRVATNLALGVVRSRSRAERRWRRGAAGLRTTSSSGRLGSAPVDDPTSALVAQRRELVEVVQSLPRRQREVVALRYLADLPEAEVAAALGCSVGTVKQHASRGLAALRRALDTPDQAVETPDPSECGPAQVSGPADQAVETADPSDCGAAQVSGAADQAVETPDPSAPEAPGSRSVRAAPLLPGGTP
jgi:RNA polymerase sigma factor (sigma-70 family)